MRTAALAAFVLLVAGCAAPEPAIARTLQFSGSTEAGPNDHFVDVPPGAAGVRVLLTGPEVVGAVDAGLFGPDGVLVVAAAPDGAGRLLAVTIEPPAPGAWTLRVQPRGQEVSSYDASVDIEEPPPSARVEKRALHVAAGRFAEWNVILEQGAEITYSFEADAPLRWDVHTHEAGGVRILAQGRSAEGNGTLEAAMAGIYSILWDDAPEGGANVTARVEGPFRDHSQHE